VRKIKTTTYHFLLACIDRKTVKFLGYLDNITTVGVMIIIEDPVITIESHKLQKDLPENIYPKSVINFQCCSLWRENDNNPNFYNAGFRLTLISLEEREIFTCFI